MLNNTFRCLASRNLGVETYASAAGIPPCLTKSDKWGGKPLGGTFFGDVDKVSIYRKLLAGQFEETRLSIGEPIHQTAFPKRIGVLSLSGMGGSGKVARDCAQAMAKVGHHVKLYCNKLSFFSQEDTPNVSLVPVDVPSEPRIPDGSWEPALAEALFDNICSEAIDVLHVHYLAGLLEAALIAKRRLAERGRQVKVVATLHGSEVSNFGNDQVFCHKMSKLLADCDAVTAVSHWLASEAKRVFSLPQVPEVIWNSIDIGRFNPGKWDGLRRNLVASRLPMLCHVSNFRPVKRTFDTVEIQASLADRGIPTKLLLIGSGPDVEKTLGRARQLGTHDNVIAIGSLMPHHLARYVAASDLALVTSTSESFSLAALEAMACGIPVVGTRCGGLDEVVDGIDWKIGVDSKQLAEVGDVDAMAEICATLLNHRGLYRSVQLQGIFAPLTRFHTNHQTAGYVRLIDSLP